MDFEKLSIKYRTLILTIFISITIFLGFFLKNIKFNSDVSKLIPTNEKTEETTDKNNNNSLLPTIVMFKNKRGIFNKETFEKVNKVAKEITDILKLKPNSVTSIFTYFPQFKKDAYTDEEMTKIREKINSTPFIKNKFINNDATLMLFIVISTENNKINFGQSLKNEIEKMEATIKKYETDDLKLYLTGDLIIREKILSYMADDFKFLGPFATFIVILSLYLIMGNILGAIIPVLIAIFAIIWTFGIKSLVMSPITVPETSMIVLLISIGCANSVHIINGILKKIKKEPLTEKIIINTIQTLKVPILLTSLTTAFGFLSLTGSSIHAYRTMGIFMSLGVIIAMLMSLLVLPGILVKIPFKNKKIQEDQKSKNGYLEKLSLINQTVTNWMLNNKYLSSIITLTILLISIIGLFKIEINFDEKDYFKESTSVKQILNLMQKEIGGMSIIKMDIKGSPNEFKNEKTMKILDLITDKIDQFNENTQSNSINQLVRLMNFKFKKENPKEYRLPENQAVLNKLILLISRSNSIKNIAKMYINDDWSQISMIIRTDQNSTEEIKNFANYASNLIEKYMPDHKYQFSGAYEKILISKIMVVEQITNIIATLSTITILLMLFFKSIKTGIIIATPVVWSVFLNFAVMKLFGITLNPATATIASVSMGIGVDYSIHFFNAFRLNYQITKDYKKALIESIPNVFDGIFANSISVGIGFLTLIFSTYKIISTLGAIIAFTMITTSLASLTLLPLLIYLFKPTVQTIKVLNKTITE
ncbi:RND family transporter [Borrelia miyamotoi]|uniref:Efflux RND transporter permease subunit n=1 Tax=Borrelia miyamotoi TaxID=47466 RepID=A0AAX3JM21_9SPIR|nr:efflux RND transporter permease subunit [Borrelia miyamotoi]QFP42066.1 RND family transporter [Borrelia miyamotoi]QFP48182.1 efflux RND transporter permease subunit [Borrelia miyamotoi]QGT55941.1 MMPL family transporter [Borrelia miyamotoi]QGT56721.1 MMPL family transporter [Borrelia miyamotoi]WAZ71981.1 efflux RND transporter permease subunit [Borrelia miyamotoi]